MQRFARRAARATAFATLLLVALAAAAMVRGAPEGSAPRRASVDVSGVLAAVEGVALVVGVVALVVLIALLVQAIRSGQAPARSSDARSLLRKTVGVVLVVYLVSLVAARVLPQLLASRGGGAAAADQAAARGAGSAVGGALWPLLTLLAVAAVALVVVWFTRSARGADDLAADVRAAAASALARLDAGDPVDDVVLDAYRQLEARLAGAGVRRATTETSAELLLRALRDVEVDAASVRRLGTLYEQVRFGGRRMGKAERDEARAALAIIGEVRRSEVAGDG